MSRPTLTHSARSYGAMIAAWFGAAWLVAWRNEVDAPKVILIAILVCASFISAAAFFQARQLGRMGVEVSGTHRARRMRLYGVINVAQWLLIFAAAMALVSTGHSQWIVAAVILIVGLHFIPLGSIFADRLHYVTGMSLVLLACLYPFLSRSGPQAPIGLLGAGVTLWLSAIAAVAANYFQQTRGTRY